jgi:hypothetical protein
MGIEVHVSKRVAVMGSILFFIIIASIVIGLNIIA